MDSTSEDGSHVGVCRSKEQKQEEREEVNGICEYCRLSLHVAQEYRLQLFHEYFNGTRH